MAFADGGLISESEIQAIPGERWLPKPGSYRDEGMLRVPEKGTLNDLKTAHASALNRIAKTKKQANAVQKPGKFNLILYSSSNRPLGPPCAIFALRQPDGDFAREPQMNIMHLAGMLRHATLAAMEGYPPPDIASPADWLDNFVAGHRKNKSNAEHRQFSYVPLPSIGHEHADCEVRRIMIVAPFGCDAWLEHAAAQLDGQTLTRESGQPGPMLERIRGDGVTRCYTATAKVWHTVTPVILPGFTDGKPEKASKLLSAALASSGIEQNCDFSFGPISHFKHALTAYRHDRQGRPLGHLRPGHLDHFTAVHVTLTFSTPVAGPIMVGPGRHCGLGTLAAAQ